MTTDDFDEEINISNKSSKQLCQIIISCRYLKINQNLNIRCMEELTKRRLNGDNFDFESYIENNIKILPNLNISVPNFQNLLRQAMKK